MTREITLDEIAQRRAASLLDRITDDYAVRINYVLNNMPPDLPFPEEAVARAVGFVLQENAFKLQDERSNPPIDKQAQQDRADMPCARKILLGQANVANDNILLFWGTARKLAAEATEDMLNRRTKGGRTDVVRGDPSATDPDTTIGRVRGVDPVSYQDGADSDESN